MIYNIMTVAVTGIITIMAFVVGAKIGQQSTKGERIEFKGPITTAKEHIAMNEYKKEQERNNIMMENVNNYDGTGIGQKEIW